MTRRLLSAFSAVLVLLAPAMAQEGGLEARVDAYFANLVEHPQELRALMQDQGPMTDALWAVTERTYIPVFADPAFVPYVVRRMPEYLALGLTEEATLVAFAGLGDAGFLGASRLPPKKMEAFFRSISDLLDWLRESSPEFCATMGVFAGAPAGTPAAEDFAPFVQLVTTALSTPDQARDAGFVRFVELFAEAALAEVRGFPEARSLTPGPALAASAEAYRTAFIERMSRPETAGLQLAFDQRLGVDQMSPAVLCDAIGLVFDTLWDLPPDQRGTMLLAVLLASTDPEGFQSIMGGY